MSLPQLSATGAQDNELTLKPTRTFFQSKYKRHTPFAQEPKEIQFQNAVAYGRKMELTIPRSADLLAKMYLCIDLGKIVDPLDPTQTTTDPALQPSYVNDVGRAIIEEISIEAGSVKYDALHPEYMHAWQELSIPKERHLGLLTGMHNDDATVARRLAKNDQRLYIPLEFWFQRDYSAAIPLISLHLTDMKLQVRLKNKIDIISKTWNVDGSKDLSNTAEIQDMFLVGEFIYLDDNERAVFARSRHKYLVHQVQRLIHNVPKLSSRVSIPINFNHPTKEFIILFRTESATAAKQWFNFAGQETGKFAGHGFQSMAITLNNNDRVQARDPLYFNTLQTSEHHTRVPTGDDGVTKPIYCYSFAIAPESTSPSGSLNLSRIENTRIELTFSQATTEAMDVIVFARSINMVRVFSGVSSLKWSS